MLTSIMVVIDRYHEVSATHLNDIKVDSLTF
jgi:hypothetical protein